MTIALAARLGRVAPPAEGRWCLYSCASHQTYRPVVSSDKARGNEPRVTWVTRRSLRYGRGGGGGAVRTGRRTSRPPFALQGVEGRAPVSQVPSLQRAVAPSGGTSAGAATRLDAGKSAADCRAAGGGGTCRTSAFTGGSTATVDGRTESTGGLTRASGATGAAGCATELICWRARGATEDGGGVGAFGLISAGAESRGGFAIGGPA